LRKRRVGAEDKPRRPEPRHKVAAVVRHPLRAVVLRQLEPAVVDKELAAEPVQAALAVVQAAVAAVGAQPTHPRPARRT